MMKCTSVAGFLVLLLHLPLVALAQEADTTGTAQHVRVVLSDGSVFTGRVVGETETTLRLRTEAGAIVELPTAEIRHRERLAYRASDGRYLHPDPNRTRLLFAPTARPLGRGSGYFSVYEVFFPFLAVGAGEAVSLAGGLSLLPTFQAQLFYVAPKVTLIDRPRQSLAVGTLAGTVLGDADGGYGGVVYGLGTFGPSTQAVTAGAGMAFGNEGVATEQPVVVLGGEYQISNRAKLLSENYAFVGEEPALLLSAGVRFFGDTLAADLSFFTTVFDEGGIPFFPFISFAYNF